MKQITLISIKFYQLLVSPLLVSLFGTACRQNPSCSKYSYDSVKKFGFFRGVKMSLTRFIRCNPLTS